MTTYTSSAAKMHSGYDIRDEHGKMVAIVHSPQGDTLRGERVAHLMAPAGGIYIKTGATPMIRDFFVTAAGALGLAFLLYCLTLVTP